MADPRAATLDAYCRLFEELAPHRLDELRSLCTPDVHFVDPFNDVAGIDRYVALYRHMFGVVQSPRFAVDDRALGHHRGFVRWRFAGRFRGRDLALEGVAELLFDPATARVAAHADHWDAAAQVYSRLPVLGGGIRLLRRLFSAGV